MTCVGASLLAASSLSKPLASDADEEYSWHDINVKCRQVVGGGSYSFVKANKEYIEHVLNL